MALVMKSKLNLLVLCEAYPNSENPYQLMYAHTRNVEYLKSGCAVTVLSFSAGKSYEYDGIRVITEKELIDKSLYDLVISHAPNVRNHLRILSTNLKNSEIVMFIHGHEVLDTTKYYFGRYDGKQFSFIRKIYEKAKLRVFSLFLNHNYERVSVVFVSNWMRKHFYENLNLRCEIKNEAVINNSVNPLFLENRWNTETKKEFDFITIRPLSEKKYAVDVVLQLALKYPSKSFLLYGRGNIFNYLEKPKNVIYRDSFLQPNEILDLLNKSICALMPTRLDAQGVMMCEMASYGIPLITSDIEICTEMLQSFPNVAFINNDAPEVKAIPCSGTLQLSEKFASSKLVAKELAFFKKLAL